MEIKNTGGPAFPQVVRMTNGAISHVEGGMTLRDYFAAAAMRDTASDRGYYLTDREIAQRAYALADAMLEER
jgi:hypothetical protein